MPKLSEIEKYPYPENLFKMVCSVDESFNQFVYTTYIGENLVNLAKEILTNRDLRFIKYRYVDLLNTDEIAIQENISVTKTREFNRKIIVTLANSSRFMRILTYPNSPDSEIDNMIRKKIFDHNVPLSKIFIEEINISSKTCRLLKRHNIFTVEELVRHSRKDLYNFRYVGDISVNDVIKALDAIGLSLKEDNNIDNTANQTVVYKEVVEKIDECKFKLISDEELNYSALFNFLLYYIKERKISIDDLAIELIAFLKSYKSGNFDKK